MSSRKVRWILYELFRLGQLFFKFMVNWRLWMRDGILISTALVASSIHKPIIIFCHQLPNLKKSGSISNFKRNHIWKLLRFTDIWTISSYNIHNFLRIFQGNIKKLRIVIFQDFSTSPPHYTKLQKFHTKYMFHNKMFDPSQLPFLLRNLWISSEVLVTETISPFSSRILETPTQSNVNR